MYQASEVVEVMLVVFLTPMVWIGFRSIQTRGKSWFTAGYIAMACGFVATVIEGYVAPELFNLTEHAAYAFSGVCIAIAVRASMHEAREQAGLS